MESRKMSPMNLFAGKNRDVDIENRPGKRQGGTN